jgi:hypothetical protein
MEFPKPHPATKHVISIAMAKYRELFVFGERIGDDHPIQERRPAGVAIQETLHATRRFL